MAADFSSHQKLETLVAGKLGAAGSAVGDGHLTNHINSVLRSVIGTEFLLVAATAYVASAAYNFAAFGDWPKAIPYVPASISIAALVVLISFSLRHYDLIQTRHRYQFLWRGAVVVALAFSIVLTAMFVLKVAESYSRLTFMAQFAAVCGAVMLWRAVSYRKLQFAISSGQVEARRVVVIGEAALYAAYLDRLSQFGTRVVGSFPFPAAQCGNSSDADYKQSDGIRNLVEACRVLRPDDILLATTFDDPPRTLSVAVAMSDLPVAVHLLPLGVSDLLGTSEIAEVGGVKTFQLLHLPLSTFDRVVKRAFDISAAIAGLILLSPLLMLVTVAIKLDSRGPVFFRQTRNGFNNENIRVLKFRSMNVSEDGDRFTQATRADSRITNIGRVLRLSGIDELPQLFNVLTGEMSIVGPRPHATAHNAMFDQLLSGFSRRHTVKPGITGWAQVNGLRGETDTIEKMQKRVEYDLYYIDNWSFLFDLKIIALTLLSRKVYTSAF